MFEGFLFLGTLVPGLVGASEVEEGSSYGREVLNEVMVEVDETYESLYISLVFQDGPLVDSGNLNRVHHNLVLRDDQSEVFNLLLVEFTFLWMEE